MECTSKSIDVEFVDKGHSVHENIMDLVARMAGSLASTINEWIRLKQRAKPVEIELAEETGTASGRHTKETSSTPTRTRSQTDSTQK